MSDIPPITNVGRPLNAAPSQVPASSRPMPSESPVDEVEISETGRMLSTLDSEQPLRLDKITQIKQAIANGTYETDEKLQVTIDRLLEALQTQSLSI